MAQKVARLEVNQTQLWTSVQGQGPPLLLLNGGPGCCDYLEPVTQLLEGVATVYRFEERGCGRSDTAASYSLEQTLADIEALRQHWEIRQWVVAGHSWGADLALAYALHYPEATRALIHLCGTGVQNDRDWKAAYTQSRATGLEPDLAYPYPPNPEVNRLTMQSWRRFIKQPDLLLRISRLEVPALVVVASNDIRPRWPNEQIAQLLPKGRLEVIEGAGHNLWLSHAPALQQLLHTYLGTLSPPQNHPKYSMLEIERRWRVDLKRVNLEGVAYRTLTDLYIQGTRLRLRKEEGSKSVYKLCKKYGKVSEQSEPITNFYLSEPEYRLLARLPGNWVSKQRYRLEGGSLDVYPNAQRLAFFEKEFTSEEAAKAYIPPAFVGEEVTGEAEQTGAAIAKG